jgi:hypothetical protein
MRCSPTLARSQAAVVLALCTGWACAPRSSTSEVLDEAVALVIVQLDGEGALRAARVIEPYVPGDEVNLPLSASLRTLVLGYPRPLVSYGLRVERGALAVEDDVRAGAGEGDPLPTPVSVLEASPTEVRRRVIDPRELAAVLSRVRVPRATCPVPVVTRRLPVPTDAELRFVLPIGEQELLVGTRAGSSTSAVAVVGRVSLEEGAGGPMALVPVSITEPSPRAPPCASLDAEGRAFVAYARTRAGRIEPWTCVVLPGSAARRPACSRDVFEDRPPANWQIAAQDVAPFGEETSRLVVVHDGARWLAYEGTVDVDRVTHWRLLLEGPPLTDTLCASDTADARVVARLEGPGRGIVSFPGAELVRYTREGERVTREALWVVPGRDSRLCRASYARHPLGGELLVESVPEREAELWWRGPTDTSWSRLDARELGVQAVVAAHGQAMLTLSQGRAAVVFRDDQRPDLSPQICAPVAVGNNATLISDDGDEVLVAGTPTTDEIEPLFAWVRF